MAEINLKKLLDESMLKEIDRFLKRTSNIGRIE